MVKTHTSFCHYYEQDLMKLNLQAARFASDAMRMLNGARLSSNGLHSILEVAGLITE